MERVTISQLRHGCAALNRATNSPQEYWQKPDDKNNREISVGHWHIDRAYGGYQLCRTSNNRGGCRSYGGHTSARVCMDRISAMLDAFWIAQEENL